MCLTISKANYAKDADPELPYRGDDKPMPLVAAEPMAVYKETLWLGDISPQRFLSEIYKKEYVLEAINPTVELRPTRIALITPRENPWFVEEGYHAYLSKESPDRRLGDVRSGVFLIPPGSKYYLGADGDIVSDRIIYMGTYCEWKSALHGKSPDLAAKTVYSYFNRGRDPWLRRAWKKFLKAVSGR